MSKPKTQNPKPKILILGGGPAGLYCGLLIKKADPSREITIIERNPAGVTYGWGVVFSDRTLASFQRADYKTYQQIADNFVIWDAIDVHYRGETVRCGGHVIAAISRKVLLDILQRRCIELGVEMKFEVEVNDLTQLPPHDLLIASDGVNSITRKMYEEQFKPSVEWGKAMYIWLGADKVLDAFNFIFRENEHGLFQVHAYPFSGATSTFIVECDEQSWLNAGLDKSTEAESLAYCQTLLDEHLNGTQLISNNSKWLNFPTLKTKNWHIQNPKSGRPLGHQNTVLLGDAAHTAHFSIGAGTKLAMEDAVALATALDQHSDIEAALNEYELERKPVVETFQRAAAESQAYFETIKRYLGLPPMQFAFQLLTRSGRISYDDLHFRDARFGDMVDRYMARLIGHEQPLSTPILAPPPIFAPLKLRGLAIPSRIVTRPFSDVDLHGQIQVRGAGLVMIEVCAVSADGRVSPDSSGMYNDTHKEAWTSVVEKVHKQDGSVGIQLGHAGRRGAVRPRSEGLDRPLREGGWPLISASSIPYTTRSQVPKEMDRTDMDSARDDFVQAAHMSDKAGFDLLQLHFAHGYLLASFLSPLTNLRTDEYGGDPQKRTRFPLEVFDAVRAIWPQEKPMSVALSGSDWARGGVDLDEVIAFAILLKEHGCDLIEVLAGQTTPASEPPYSRGFLTPLSDRIRNGAGIPTMVGGYLTTSSEANTILAAGRADLCIMSTTT
ncbi:MAG: FAD-dependent monooxygenase [Chloroflexia bacterium]